jgi:uncharacterized SAM-binding protein YcdF (DUF218 family)
MFLFIKIIELMLSPFALFCEFALISLLLLCFKKKIAAWIIFVLSFGMLLFLSYDYGQYFLANPLEKTYGVCNPLNYPEVKTVVVLGGGRYPESDRPVSAKMSYATTVRLVEGIKIFNLIDAQKLFVTGKDYNYDSSIAALMKQCAIDLGVDGEKIFTVDNARNTREEARYTAEIVRGDTVFLVTSAAHLKRAVKNFGDEGIFVVPVPTDYIVQNKRKSISYYFPDPQRIVNSGKAIHEYLGLFAELFNK